MSFASIQSNVTYYLTNVQTGTCLDISGDDGISIIGFPYHYGSNQKWIFQSAGINKTYYIKSVGANVYLAAKGDPQDRNALVASPAPYAWHLQHEPREGDGMRIFCPGNVNYCIDLADGNAAPRTRVQLWGRHDLPDLWNQVWKLNRAD